MVVIIRSNLLLFLFRYFTSGPPSTEPAALPRPPPKRDPLNSKASDFNPQEGPTVLSPPRKARRVMPQREGFEGSAQQVGKSEIRQGAGSGNAPMSLDFSVFESRPPARPTINR